MSEHAAFDPLAEARRNASPEKALFDRMMGNPEDYANAEEFRQANEDLADYLESRDPAKRDQVGGDIYEQDLVSSAHTEALEEEAARNLSLQAMAERVAEARKNGDMAAAAHLEDLFYDKFTALAEKYGWEEDDDSANDTLRVDKNAKVGRTTIDDRLARYSKIMYGEDAVETPAVETETPAEAPSAAVEMPEEKPAENEAKPAEVEPAAAKAEAFDVDAETEQAKERLNKRAEELEQQANAERGESEAAKADRELLARVSKEGLEDDEEPAPIAKVSKEGLDADEKEEGKIARVSKEGIEGFDDDEVEPSNPAKNFLGRARNALNKARDLYLRAAFEVGHTVDLAKQELSKRGGRKEGETEEQYERRMRRNGRNIALGIVALAGASIAAKTGAFDGLFDGNHSIGSTPAEAADTTTSRQGGGREGLKVPSYSADALRVDNGEGLYQTFEEMGIPKDKWQAVLDQSGPKLVRMGEAYRDPSIGGFGLNGDGRLSKRALDVISESARNVK